MNKLSFYFLSLVVLLSFMGCKKTSDPDPTPVQAVTIKYPFKVQLAYPLADTTNPVLEVNPNGLLKLIFRLSADERITVIDFLTKDQEKGEQSLKGYPYVVESYDPTPPSNAQIQYIGSNNFYLTQMIRIPNYVKDSVVITVKIVKYDLSSKSMKLVLKVKKQVNFQISGVSLNAVSFTGNPLTMYAGDLIRSFGGSVNTAGELTKLTAALWVDNEKTATAILPFGRNSYDEYEDVYSGYESNITSHKFYYNLSVTSSMLPVRQEYAGKNTRVRFTALNDLGDSASLEVPILIGTRNILQTGPFNLGAVRSLDYGQFLYTVISGPVVSADPEENFSYYDPFSVIGFFRQNGEHRLASLAWIYTNRVALGYAFPNYYNTDRAHNTYFRKVSDSFEAVNSLYLDTMQVESTDPEAIAVQPNDVVVFSSSQNRLQRGVLKVHSIVPGDSGSVLLSCKYQIR
jgi:hypothetical protein